MGGGRNGKWIKTRNTIIIFLTSGLWHGANWTYVFWGLYHALLFVPLILTGGNKKYNNIVAEGKRVPSIREFFNIVSTFVLILFGWIIFRATSLCQTYGYMRKMFDYSSFTIPNDPLTLIKLLIFCSVLIIIEWFQRQRDHGLDLMIKSPIVRYAIYFTMLFLVIAGSGNPVTFIYFQF